MPNKLKTAARFIKINAKHIILGIIILLLIASIGIILFARLEQAKKLADSIEKETAAKIERSVIERQDILQVNVLSNTNDVIIYDILPEDMQPKYYDVPLSEDLQNYIFNLCDEYDVDAAIIIAMIDRESKYTADAIGDGGNSLGLMQIQPQWNEERMDELDCPDLLDPYQNVTVGIDILADYINQNGSIEWALMAYNGGPSYAYDMWDSGQLSDYASSIIYNASNLELE